MTSSRYTGYTRVEKDIKILSSHLNAVMTQSGSRDLGQVGGQVLVNVLQHQSEVQVPAHWHNRRIQQPGH